MSKLLTFTPYLLTRDLQATIAFYSERLGFELDMAWPEDDPTHAFLYLGNIEIGFYSSEPGVPGMTGQLRIEVEDIQALFERLDGTVPILSGPEVYSYGRREFTIQDNNGYTLLFSEPTADEPTAAEAT